MEREGFEPICIEELDERQLAMWIAEQQRTAKWHNSMKLYLVCFLVNKAGKAKT